MNWIIFWELFHKAWGQAHDSPEYDKKVYSEMHHMLQDMEDSMKPRKHVVFDGIHKVSE
jgi:hypothetical protein